VFPEAAIRYHGGSGIYQQDDILRVEVERNENDETIREGNKSDVRRV